MRSSLKQRRVANAGDIAMVTGTEIVVATLAGISTQAPDGRVNIDGWAQVSGGAAVTNSSVAIRRGSLAGALVGESNQEAHAANAVLDKSISVQDTPGDGTFTYVMTATTFGGPGTTIQSSLSAEY